MFGAIYIGLSGLSAYSDGLSAVSNNVSNLNTSGFKASEISFSDVFGSGSLGGLEYAQSNSGSGHGVNFNELTINFEQGELRQTDRDLDLAIDGSGFFVLQEGDQTYYTRTGSFAVSDEGFIVLAGTQMKLAVLDGSGRPVSLNIDQSRTNAPEQTTKITFSDNLSSTATSYSLADIKVFDQRGGEHVWSLELTRPETVFDEWDLEVKDAAGTVLATSKVKFENGVIDPTTSSISIEDTDNGLTVELDFADVTSFSSGSVSSLRAANVDGHSAGIITALAINQDGQLEITYSNEETLELGAVAMADFRDPQRLDQRSNGLFAHDGYGQVQYLSAQDTRVGSILSRRLEASNVDLGGQFGDLILIQRGFQASSQIISVSNDMIQQLFGIRGQG